MLPDKLLKSRTINFLSKIVHVNSENPVDEFVANLGAVIDPTSRQTLSAAFVLDFSEIISTMRVTQIPCREFLFRLLFFVTFSIDDEQQFFTVRRSFSYGLTPNLPNNCIVRLERERIHLRRNSEVAFLNE